MCSETYVFCKRRKRLTISSMVWELDVISTRDEVWPSTVSERLTMHAFGSGYKENPRAQNLARVSPIMVSRARSVFVAFVRRS